MGPRDALFNTARALIDCSPVCSTDNQFRMSILERLEQMERRMAEMSGQQQQQQQQGGGGTSESGVTGGGGGGGGGGGNADQTQVCNTTRSSIIRHFVTWSFTTEGLNSPFSLVKSFSIITCI